MTNLGFKKLTVDNWLEPDEVSCSFVRISPTDGEAHPITGNEYVNDILKPSLIETVPMEIQALFEVARSALGYGYFFYPLYTLGGEQLFRVVEAAVAHKCKAMEAPRCVRTFEKQVDYLILEKVIPEQEGQLWYAIRQLRNIASHPKSQSILPPGPVIGILERTAEKINALFRST